MENSFQMSSYISIPLTIITVIACVHLIFIIAIKVRNTAKTSFILFASLAIFTIGTFYSIHSKNIITFIITILIAQLSLLPYLFILATGFKKSKLDDAKNFEQGTLDTSSSKKIEHLISISQELSEAASHSIARDTDVNEFLDFICNKLMEATESSGAIILSADEYENTLSVKSLLGNFPPVQKLPENIPLEKGAVQSYLKSSSFPFHGNIFGEASFAPSPILITNGAKDKRIYQNGEEDFLSCGSFIFFPIKLPNSASAVAVLSRTTSEPQFTNDDLQNARLVVNSLSTIIMPLASAIEFTTHQQLNKEGDTASKFHNELLQKKFPKFNTLSFGCWTLGAEYICGDYYEVNAVRKDRISFVLSDVAGKGMHSFTIMVMLRAMLHIGINTAQSSAKILDLLNKGLCKETFTQDHFASMTLVNYNPLSKVAQIATCGRTSVFFYNANDKDVSALSISSEPLGIASETSYKDIDLPLNSGDILVICTDGLLESFNQFGVQYSSENLVNALHSCATLQGNEIAEHIKKDIQKYTEQAQQYDDMSLMVIKIK